MDVIEIILYPESNRLNALWSHCLPAHTQNLIIFPFLRQKGVVGEEIGINQEFLQIGVQFDLAGERRVS